MPAPLIQREDTRSEERLRLRLLPELSAQLIAYSQFAESSPNHIINAALSRLFAADKGFKDFLKSHPSAAKPESLKGAPVPVRASRKLKEESVQNEPRGTAA